MVIDTSEEFDRWLEYAQWRGQTVQALKEMTSQLKQIKEDISQIKVDNHKRDIKTAKIAGGTSMLVVMLGWLITFILGSA